MATRGRRAGLIKNKAWQFCHRLLQSQCASVLAANYSIVSYKLKIVTERSMSRRPTFPLSPYPPEARLRGFHFSDDGFAQSAAVHAMGTSRYFALLSRSNCGSYGSPGLNGNSLPAVFTRRETDY
jgi:hypothetical protein